MIDYLITLRTQEILVTAESPAGFYRWMVEWQLERVYCFTGSNVN